MQTLSHVSEAFFSLTTENLFRVIYFSYQWKHPSCTTETTSSSMELYTSQGLFFRELASPDFFPINGFISGDGKA
jgi:hypothetical protein